MTANMDRFRAVRDELQRRRDEARRTTLSPILAKTADASSVELDATAEKSDFLAPTEAAP